MSNEPVIGRIIDSLDYYKFTMAYFARKYFKEAEVRYAFKNRTSGIRLLQHIDIDRLDHELKRVRARGFSAEEIGLLHGRDEFSRFPEWFFDDFLPSVSLPQLSVENRQGRLHIETEGTWTDAIWWETVVLATISELYWESVTEELGFTKEQALDLGQKRLADDLLLLRRNAPDAKIALFGARRRFSDAMENLAHEVFLDVAPELLTATSTVGKGIRYDIPITGTNAHELPMVLFSLHWAEAGDDADLGEIALTSQQDMLDKWWELYGEDLSVGLTDTYGTDFFLTHFGRERAETWRGLRQDSGDPLSVGQKYLDFYRRLGIDPKEKLLLFTDGLVRPTIELLQREFGDATQIAFGWGTGATNNVFPNNQYYRHASMVMKAVEGNGKPNAKLTDNPMKAAGDPVVAERLKEALGHTDGPAITPVF